MLIRLLLITILMFMPLQADTYTVRGQIMFENQPPYPGAFELALCTVISDGMMCVLDVVPPGPRVSYDENGYFEFEGIPDETYGLVLYMSYFKQVLAWWPDGSSEVLFTVDGGDVDLGTLAYDDCPAELFTCMGRILFFPVVYRE